MFREPVDTITPGSAGSCHVDLGPQSDRGNSRFGHPVVRGHVTFSCHNDGMHDISLEGWFSDPYDRHEARWMSRGTPTALVRDGQIEGSDPVADEPFKVTPVRIEAEGPGDGSDQRRRRRRAG